MPFTVVRSHYNSMSSVKSTMPPNSTAPLQVGFDIIGVNNRNLHTFQVDLNTSLQLAKRIPAQVLKIAESGIESATDIARLRDNGFDAFLIGESLMRAPNPGDALRGLLGKPASIST